MGEARELVDRMWELIERGELDRLEELVVDDVEMVMPGTRVEGVEALRAVLRTYLEAFPDLRHTIVNTIEAGDQISVELSVAGTHSGPMATPLGVVPATGNRLTLASTDCVRVAGGRIASWRVYFDSAQMAEALGLVPAPAA